MIAFKTILWICYVLITVGSIPYLRKSYFPRNTLFAEKFVIFLLALTWFVSMPITAILKQDEEGEEL